MNRGEIKKQIRAIERYYDFNHTKEGYDITCDLEQLTDLVMQLNQEAVKEATEKSKPQPKKIPSPFPFMTEFQNKQREPHQPNQINWDIPDLLIGYDEASVIQRTDLAVLKYLHSYQLPNYSGLLHSVAKDTVHEYFKEKSEGKDPKFKTTLGASEVISLLRQVEDALQEQCEKLTQAEHSFHPGMNMINACSISHPFQEEMVKTFRDIIENRKADKQAESLLQKTMEGFDSGKLENGFLGEQIFGSFMDSSLPYEDYELVDMYANANEHDREIIDKVLINLTGWSMESLLTKAFEEREKGQEPERE